MKFIWYINVLRRLCNGGGAAKVGSTYLIAIKINMLRALTKVKPMRCDAFAIANRQSCFLKFSSNAKHIKSAKCDEGPILIVIGE